MINLLGGINSTSSALNAERIRMDVISQNIANVNTSKGLDGKPYQRQQAVFETVLGDIQSGSDAASSSLRISRVEKDGHAPRMIHMPGHPDADANGMVAMPDINIPEEMADMINSSRTFEANLAVIKNARQMAMQSLAIGKH